MERQRYLNLNEQSQAQGDTSGGGLGSRIISFVGGACVVALMVMATIKIGMLLFN